MWEVKKPTSKSIIVGSVGGLPNLKRPREYPACKICREDLVYYFTFNIDHIQTGLFFSVFYCIKCTGSTTPDLPADLHARVSYEECSDLQREYRIFFHRNKEWIGSIVSPLVPAIIYGSHSRLLSWPQSHLAGRPSDAELSQNEPGIFMLQIREPVGLKFPIIKDSPNQQAYVLFSDDEEFPHRGYYTFINEIPVYFYASVSKDSEMCGFIITGRF